MDQHLFYKEICYLNFHFVVVDMDVYCEQRMMDGVADDAVCKRMLQQLVLL
jgi:hypothetical protein